MQTLDQKYAADVYKKVSAVKKSANPDDCNKYGSMAHQLPILIRSAGLAQALAFLKSRDTDGHKRLLTDLSATVGQPGTLLQRAREAPLEEYIHLTRRVMAALLWYKRFAQSILDIKTADVAKDANLAVVPDVEARSTEGEKR